MKSFSATEAIKFGWEVAKSKWQLFLGLILLNILLNILGEIPNWSFGKDSDEAMYLGLILFLPLTIAGVMVSAGMYKIPLMLVDGKEAKFSDVFVRDWRLLLKFVFTGFLSGLIVFLGFLLLIIPGIIFSIRLSQAPYFALDKGLGPIMAIKASWRATKGNVWELLGLGFLSLLVVIGGLLALVVGLVVAIPTVMVAQAYVYRKLSTKASA